MTEAPPTVPCDSATAPLVSVLMPVRDGERFLAAALESVLSQTLRDFEVVVVDDGSSDQSPSLVARVGDPRVRLFQQRRLGITRALNRGLQHCKGRYIARQDADDLSHHRRLASQAEFLDAHPDVGMVACPAEVIDPSGRVVRVQPMPLQPQAIAARLSQENCITHGSVMIRRDVLRRVGAYREEFALSQDYDLWLRLVEDSPIGCLPSALYQYRVSSSSVSVRYPAAQRAYRQLARELARARANGGRDMLQAGERASFRDAFRCLVERLRGGVVGEPSQPERVS